jgi:DNA-binding transcriptional LysR family regulator
MRARYDFAMDTATLEIFVEVMRRGSFAAVARDRGTDPSSISRQIAGLEEELAVRLFQRNTRRLSATEAGTAYFNRIEPLLEKMQEARQWATDMTDQPKGVLRVTASVSFGQRCIVPVLADFTTAFPTLTVELALTDSVLDLVTERIDVAIRLGPLADASLVAHRLLRSRYFVCASPDYLARHGPIRKPQDIRDHDCLRFTLPGFRSRWTFRGKKGEQTEIPVQGRVLISSGIALHECALAGMGLVLLPQWLVGKDLQTGRLVDVFPDLEVTPTDFNTAAWFVYPSKNRLPKKVRVFVDYLKKEIRDNPPWMR